METQSSKSQRPVVAVSRPTHFSVLPTSLVTSILRQAGRKVVRKASCVSKVLLLKFAVISVSVVQVLSIFWRFCKAEPTILMEANSSL